MAVFDLASRNSGLLTGTAGDDLVQGTSAKPAIVNGRNGVIRLRQGDDTIRFRSCRNPGVVKLGAGRDWLTGLDTLLNGRVSRQGDPQGGIWMGHGADRIGSPSERLRIDSLGSLDLGAGRDQIWATDLSMEWAQIDLGPGNDLIDAMGQMYGAILAGAGDDRIIAGGGLFHDPDGGYFLGPGDDLLDVTAGFYGYNGVAFGISMGSGNDVFRGFRTPWSNGFKDPSVGPWGTLEGGKGWDVHALPQGRYVVAREASNFYRNLYSLTHIGSGLAMHISGINELRGLEGGGGAIKEGVFVVTAAGLGAFA